MAEDFSSLAKDLRSKRELISGQAMVCKERQGNELQISSRREKGSNMRPLISSAVLAMRSDRSTAQMSEPKKNEVYESRMSCPPLDLTNLSTCEQQSWSSCSPATALLPPTSKDLMLSAGAVRGRYRDLRKSEEKKTSDRHSRILKRHSETLQLHVSPGSRLEDSIAFSAEPELQETIISPPQETFDEASYPPNTVFLSALSYSQYCTDPAYKTLTLATVRRELLRGHHVTLRSGLGLPSAEESLRESKQVLRSVYFSCATLTAQDIPPPITEGQGGQGELCEMTLVPKTTASS